MNPRETVLENLMDEFVTEQTQPLDCFTSQKEMDSTIPISSMSSSSTASSFSTFSSTFTSSQHANNDRDFLSNHSMSPSSHGALQSLSTFVTTASDMQQLKDLV